MYYYNLTGEMLTGNIGLIFDAGSSTTKITLIWAFTILAVYPDIQKKLQMEIDSVIGRNRRPSYANDRNQMPYLQAFYHETMRWKSILPINLPHM